MEVLFVVVVVVVLTLSLAVVSVMANNIKTLRTERDALMAQLEEATGMVGKLWSEPQVLAILPWLMHVRRGLSVIKVGDREEWYCHNGQFNLVVANGQLTYNQWANDIDPKSGPVDFDSVAKMIEYLQSQVDTDTDVKSPQPAKNGKKKSFGSTKVYVKPAKTSAPPEEDDDDNLFWVE